MAPETTPVPDPAAVEATILDFLQQELLAAGTRVDRHTDLLSGEVLDSMSVLRLAAFVGEAFAIDVQPADFVVDNFRNVEAIARYVHRAATARAAERS
jgi:acyl carrier protein